MDLKLYEAFLEGGPQSIVQLMIVMQGGLINYFQIVTIITSLLSFTLAATEIYLRYPTKVCSTYTYFCLCEFFPPKINTNFQFHLGLFDQRTNYH